VSFRLQTHGRWRAGFAPHVGRVPTGMTSTPNGLMPNMVTTNKKGDEKGGTTITATDGLGSSD
jgi:hypothetical protein